ncbi:MAG TPA: hypothetical protein VHF88_00100 [Thermoleophilaceae bacterium]|nr:hypothetical protein [Thermoleophilaceae bacterium]
MTTATRRLGATLGLALAILAAGPAAAQALTVSEYEVTIEGEATYARSDAFPGPFGPWEQREQAEFAWRTRFPSVRFLDKQVGIASQSETTVSNVNAELYTSVPTPEGPITGACTGTTLADPPGSGWLGASVIPTPDPNVEALDVRVLGGVSFHLPNCSGSFGGGPAQSLRIGSEAEIPWGPFDQAFDLPHEAVGMGKIIQLLNATVTGERCPGHGFETASCALAWKATVTFVRTAHWRTDLDESDVPLPPKPQPGPAPGGSQILPPFEIPLPKRARLSAGGERARLTLTCPVACAGTAAAYPARRGRRARGAAVRPLARARFRAAARRPTTVVLRFGPRARREVRRAGGVRVDLRVAATAGGPAARRSVVMRRP